jgi:hypothetical protein
MADVEEKPMRIEVSRLIAATPHEVFAVLRDPHGHVDIDASGMLMDATGEPVGAVGDRFTVHMDRRALGDPPWEDYDVEVVNTVFVPDQEIAWTIEGRIKPGRNPVSSWPALVVSTSADYRFPRPYTPTRISTISAMMPSVITDAPGPV